MINEKDVPIFIISYNRLEDLKKILLRLENDGYKNIQIIDNASTDKELIDYLKKSKYTKYLLEKNWGPNVLWECHLFDDIINNNYFVLTDPDIIPIEDCPSNYIKYFYDILQKYPEKSKVGFSLKLDDIPDEYKYKYDIWRYESFYWEDYINNSDGILYDAPIDTTFALYRPGTPGRNESIFFNSIRTGYPYIARHLGWYINDFAMTDYEKQYYLSETKGNTSHCKHEMDRFRVSVILSLLRKIGIINISKSMPLKKIFKILGMMFICIFIAIPIKILKKYFIKH